MAFSEATRRAKLVRLLTRYRVAIRARHHGTLAPLEELTLDDLTTCALRHLAQAQVRRAWLRRQINRENRTLHARRAA